MVNEGPKQSAKNNSDMVMIILNSGIEKSQMVSSIWIRAKNVLIGCTLEGLQSNLAQIKVIELS